MGSASSCTHRTSSDRVVGGGTPCPGIGSSNVDDPQAFNHRFAEVNGIRMHFVDEGKGDKVEITYTEAVMISVK
jgi:hypothetical protein